MNKKQIETLLHYVTIAMEQAGAHKYLHDKYLDDYEKEIYKQPLSQEEIESLDATKCDLELQLKKFDLPIKLKNMCNEHCAIIQINKFKEFEHLLSIGKLLSKFGILLTQEMIKNLASLSKIELSLFVDKNTKTQTKITESEFEILFNKLKIS